MADQSPTPAGEQPQGGNNAQVDTSGQTPGADTTQQEQFNASAAIDKMTDAAELHEILFGEREPGAPPAAPQNANEAPKKQEPAQGKTEAEPSQPGSEEHGKENEEADAPASREPNEHGPDRISLKTLPAAERKLVAEAVNLFRNGKVATMADALKQLGLTAESTPQEQQTAQETPQQQQPPATPARQPDAPQPSPEVERITAVLAVLREQRRKAITDYDRETEAKLTDQIEDAVAELSEARASARLQQQQEARQDQLAQSAIEEVHLQHPESEDPNSFFSWRLSRAIDEFEASSGRSIREAPGKLLELANTVKDAIGTAPQQRQQVNQAPKPETQVRPLGTAAPGQNTAPRLTGEALQRRIEEASAEELFEALTGHA